MRISDWSSDVCSSDLKGAARSKARNPLPRSTFWLYRNDLGGTLQVRRSHRMSSGAWRRRLPAAALSMLLAVALTLAGAVHALPPQGSATPSSDSISRAEAFVPWICGPGTSTEQQDRKSTRLNSSQ